MPKFRCVVCDGILNNTDLDWLYGQYGPEGWMDKPHHEWCKPKEENEANIS